MCANRTIKKGRNHKRKQKPKLERNVVLCRQTRKKDSGTRKPK